MTDHIRQHHRATLRHIAALRAELDGVITQASELADTDPESESFGQLLADITALHARIGAARRLAVTLNQLLPPPDVQVLPPLPRRSPTPNERRGRDWAKVVLLPVRTARSAKTPAS